MAKEQQNNKFWLLIAALVIAVFLWAYIVGEESVEVTRHLPLELETPEGVTVAEMSIDSVAVHLSVPRHLLAVLDAEPIRFRHTIAEANDLGKFSFDLTARDVEKPSSMIQVLQIVPDRAVVTLDEVIHKRVPILANLSNEPAAGYKVDKDNIQIDPNAVLISGAKSVLEKVDYVLTEPIDIIGRIRSFRKSVRLESRLEYALNNDSLIDVFVPIKEEFVVRTFEGITVRTLNTSRAVYDVVISPEQVNVTLKGSLKDMDLIQSPNLLAFVNVAGLGPGKYQLPLQVDLPGDISLDQTSTVIDVVVKERSLLNTTSPS